MKYLSYLIIVAAVLTIYTCRQKEEPLPKAYESTGRILGQDLALCACCGNWVIEIDGNDNSFQFLELPQNSGIDLQTETFPLAVKFDWKIDDTSPCKFVIIEAIERN